MKKWHQFLFSPQWLRRQLKVYALVGKAGTGKSFRARLIAEKHNIDLIIDDGLLIRDQMILAGKSAKREQYRFKAIRRAIFEDPKHAQEIKAKLKRERFNSILIIGTSEKMIARITEQLQLPYPDQIIYIEDVATKDEMIRARESRRLEGKHVIPVPMIEVKKDPSHHVLDSIKLFLKNHPLLFWKKQIVEKTVVRPPFSPRGKLSISESALMQMIIHCIREFSKEVNINKIIITNNSNGCQIEIKLNLPFGMNLPNTMANMQEYIINSIERFSGIHINKLDLTVQDIKRK
jgi:uncharacterized alkaline shock family protein YloU